MQRIFRLLLVAAAIVLGALWLVRWQKTRALNSGEVHVRQQSGDKASTETASVNEPTRSQDTASAPEASEADQPRPHQENVASLPAAETIRRNPPNGLVAAGTGRFQLYRQGDLTFRLNTETGESCVLFASEALWRNPLVYEHGCASH
jgi:hypothetical protein